jgi:hypothetical protein
MRFGAIPELAERRSAPQELRFAVTRAVLTYNDKVF